MKPHHQKVLDRLSDLHGNDHKYLGLIICGSLATGGARDDSDVDLYLVASDEEYHRTAERREFFYGNDDLCDYDGGEIDGKIINLQFLRDAAAHGSEPTRRSFYKAFTLFSHVPEIDDLIKKIPVYPEHEREEKLKAFYSQVLHNQYYAEQGIILENDYLKIRSVSDLVLFSVRLALTYNRILFPCPKTMFEALEGAKKLPENFIARSKNLLSDMTLDNVYSYFELVVDYYSDCAMDEQERISFVLENEWTWFSRTPSVCDW